MFNFEALNKSKKTVRDEIKTEGMNFVPLKDFIGKEIHVDGFFFSEGKYGKQAVVVGEGCKINLPKRYTKDWEKIRDNNEALEAVLAGKLILTDIKPVESDNGKSVAYSFKNA